MIFNHNLNANYVRRIKFETKKFEFDSKYSDYFKKSPNNFTENKKTSIENPKDLVQKSDILSISSKLIDKKYKMFNILDNEEELIISNELEDLKREKLLKEFKNLFYKTKEIKSLLDEVSDNNIKLQNEIKYTNDIMENIKNSNETDKNETIQNMYLELQELKKNSNDFKCEKQEYESIINDFKLKIEEEKEKNMELNQMNKYLAETAERLK